MQVARARGELVGEVARDRARTKHPSLGRRYGHGALAGVPEEFSENHDWIHPEN
jgi:hypothetical protein